MSTCYVHNEVEAVGICVGCGKFICENCKTELKGKNYCKKCIEELFEENQRNLRCGHYRKNHCAGPDAPRHKYIKNV